MKKTKKPKVDVVVAVVPKKGKGPGKGNATGPRAKTGVCPKVK